MGMGASTARWQKWLLVAMLLGTSLTVLPAAVEPFMLPKITVTLLLGVALLGLLLSDAASRRTLSLPVSGVTIAATVFASSLVLATITSTSPWTSLLGWYSRYTGLLPYVSYLLAFFVTLRVADTRFVSVLRRTLVVALGAVVTYGLLQALGADPIDWVGKAYGSTFSLMANVNFAAAWAGAITPLALVTALRRDESRPWRWAGGLLIPGTLLYVVLTGTSQGPVVALVALVWAAVVLVSDRNSRARHIIARRAEAAASLVVFVVFSLIALLAQVFPFLRAQLDQAFVERPEFWAVALEIFRDHPVVGTGLDTYGHYFSQYRPASHALLVGAAGADAPHSVPLGMFANGGLVLGLSYLAVVVLIGIALVRGALRTSGADRAAVAGFGGVWLGYQAQSLVSFDVPPLALLHWVSAGVIVAVAAAPRWREFELPGRRPQRAGRRGRGIASARMPASTRVPRNAIAVLTLVAIWFALYPLRADLLAASAAPLGKSGQLDAAVKRLEKAAAMNPAEPSYPLLAAQAHQAAGRHAESYDSAVEAAERDPGAVQAALYAAWQAQQSGDLLAAERWYREAATRDPNHPAVLADVAAFFVSEGEHDEAAPYLRKAVQIEPDNAKALELLAALEEQEK
jgi:O-antigen ligase/Flp pilus assembly protein TadD